MARDYHHGDLPAALRSAAVEVLEERGPAGFSLREVARRAGVSHTAPAHHFGDAQGLLTSVAAEGFDELTAAMRAATEAVVDPYERLLACGRAYVGVALSNPGHYSLMLNSDFTDTQDPQLELCGANAYAVLLETVELLRDSLNPDLDVDRVATVLWASVHGLVEISGIREHVAENTDTELSELDDLLKTFTQMAIAGVRSA